MRRRRLSIGVAGTLALASVLVELSVPIRAQGQNIPPVKLTPEQVQYFEAQIRPLFHASCVGCHSKESPLGDLRLDAPITQKQAAEVLVRVKGEGGKPRMPQGHAPLSQEKINALALWVKDGALWPTNQPTDPTRGLWALQPVKVPSVPAGASAIDFFVGQKLKAAGLTPAPPADKRTLLRRLSYDLTGLPPTAAEVQAFLADKAPDAYEKQVDRLLASPRYGERQARFWLDLARYADTKGYVFNEDRNYYSAYTYRDWVIAAFNADMPYDRFVTYQLAADRLSDADTDEGRKHLAALGFLTLGRRFINNIHDIIDDRIDVTMRGFQGLTVSCARCHDHKFDPVPTRDYYSLYSIFASSKEEQSVISPKAVREPWEAHDRKFQAAKAEWEQIVRTETKALREKNKVVTVGDALPEGVKKALQSVREQELPSGENLKSITSAFPKERQERLAHLSGEQERLKGSYPPKPEFAHALADATPTVVNVFKRGNPHNRGEPAPRRFIGCIGGEKRPEFTEGSGRLELARAITDPKNPLTARVMANRIWLGHFGAGLVRTPSDFGRQGEKPTHPELLDWLATVFVKDGWSIKKLHKRIVLSLAYRMSADTSVLALQKDPENRLLSRQSRKRLDLEQLRDSLYLASGKLDLSKTGGASIELWEKNRSPRRAIYGFVERQNLPLIFKTFDFATPDAHSPQRFKTTVPQQALFLLNAPLVAEQTRALAALAKSQNLPDDAARTRWLYLRLFHRQPDAEEARLAEQFLAAPDGPALSESRGPWEYGWGRIDEQRGIVTEFHRLPAFHDGSWRGGEKLPDPTLGWALLTASGGHPGNREHAVIRRWTAPRDVIVSAQGLLKHTSPMGDGVRARLISSRGGLLGDWTAHNKETRTDVEKIEVKKGDRLDFVVDCRTGESFDSFAWAPALTPGPSPNPGRGGKGWSAERDFGGPPPEGEAPLSRWERYCQALLMTNEFSYVD
jgi:mono/diheme cytochrome c family protein